MTNDSSGWQRHEREQRRAWRRLTPAQRLAWLWQAKLFAHNAMGRARPAAKQPADTDPHVLDKANVEP